MAFIQLVLYIIFLIENLFCISCFSPWKKNDRDKEKEKVTSLKVSLLYFQLEIGINQIQTGENNFIIGTKQFLNVIN